MSKYINPAIIAVIIFGALLIFSVAILPPLVKNRACEAVMQITGRKARIESLSINPLTMTVRANGVVIEERGGGTFVSCASLSATISPASIYKRSLILENVTLDAPSVSFSRTAPNLYSFTDITRRLQAQKKPGLQAPLLFAINNITVANASIHFDDVLPKGGFKGALSNIGIEIKHFSTAVGSSADFKLALLADNEATFTSGGSFSVSPLVIRTTIALKGLDLQRGRPYLAQFFTTPLKGVLDLSGDVNFSNDDGLAVANGTLALSNFSIRNDGMEGVELSVLEVIGAAFKQKENSLEVAEAKLSGGNVSCSRKADGTISLLGLLVSNPGKSMQKAPSVRQNSAAVLKTGRGAVSADSKPFSYRLKRLKVDEFNLKFSDKSRTGKPSFSLRNTTLSLENLNGPRFTPAQLRFASTFGKQTPLKASGDITLQPFRFKGEVNIRRLPIRDFEKYFPENLNVAIVGGNLETALKVDIAFRNGRPGGSFKGSGGIRAFHSIDRIAEEDLLKWESLQLDEFQGSLEPFILNVQEIALNGVYSRIIIRKDGTLNLQNLMQKQDNGPVLDTPKAASAAMSVKPQNPAAGRVINIGSVTIQDGTLSFSDAHLPQQFETTIHNLGGRISGLSSKESQFADVDLRGNLENQSPLLITGTINPLRDDLFVDLKASFHDIDLSQASPYSAIYLGYMVEKGKLFLDLKYHIEKKLLTSENKIFIDQFTFGNKVESDKATSLPVKLGLALLKDRNGEIHLDVPITGSTDNPQISIWKLIWQTFKSMMVKAVTSPLSLLSSLFGSGDDFSAVQFENGSSAITPQEERKLAALAKALLDRPALKMKLQGYVDREKDIEPYRRELLNRKLRNEKNLSSGGEGSEVTDEKAETIQLLPEEYDTLLAAVYKKEKFPKPRNVLGQIKNLPPEEMSKLIIANTIIGEQELRSLARKRVETVMNCLVSKGNVPPERIFENDADVFKEPEKKSIPRSRVEIIAIVQ